jgi:hypothetical protein
MISNPVVRFLRLLVGLLVLASAVAHGLNLKQSTCQTLGRKTVEAVEATKLRPETTAA